MEIPTSQPAELSAQAAYDKALDDYVDTKPANYEEAALHFKGSELEKAALKDAESQSTAPDSTLTVAQTAEVLSWYNDYENRDVHPKSKKLAVAIGLSAVHIANEDPIHFVQGADKPLLTRDEAVAAFNYLDK